MSSHPKCENVPFEKLAAGQRTSFGASFTHQDVQDFARISGDWNSLHVDEEYASGTPFRKCVVHGMLASSLVSRVAGMYFPGQQSLLLQVDNITFNAPVFEEEELRCEAEILEAHPLFRVLAVQVKVYGKFNRLKFTSTFKVQHRPETNRINLNLENIMQTDLSDQVALVTGASRGIGAAIAEALGSCRAKVIVNYNSSKSHAEDVAHKIEKAGGKALAVKADISKPDQVSEMIKKSTKELGSIGLLVNNATPTIEATDFLQTPWDLIQNDLNVHVRGAYHCTQEILPSMLKNKFGRIVSILSVYLQSPPPKGVSSYVIAKSGLMGLTRSIAAEYGAQGITANMIAPSMVETDLTATLSEGAKRAAAMKVPIGRLANVNDVALPVVFLLSKSSQYINGAILDINGGIQF
jgi:3-oxoacyl-[acyl-carrier protein] reductase